MVLVSQMGVLILNVAYNAHIESFREESTVSVLSINIVDYADLFTEIMYLC